MYLKKRVTLQIYFDLVLWIKVWPPIWPARWHMRNTFYNSVSFRFGRFALNMAAITHINISDS